MVSHIKELSEDEKIRQQCQARADYECRLASQYERGIKEGMSQTKQEDAQKMAKKFHISLEEAMKLLNED